MKRSRAAHEAGDEGPAWKLAVRRRDDVPLREKGASERSRAMRGWVALFAKAGWQGLAAAEAVAEEPGTEEKVEALEGVFAKKATGTLLARLSHARLYTAWAATFGMACQAQPFPIAEPTAYEYTKYLVASKAPPSRADSFRTMVAFLKYACGLRGADEVLSSNRVAGKAWQAFEGKRLRVQRDPLKKAQVEALQAIALDPAEDMRDRIFAGFEAFCLAVRFRNGDAQHVEEEPSLDCDPSGMGFVETYSSALKNTRSTSRRRIRIAVVGWKVGFDGRNWAAAWLELRAQEGLRVETQGCLMPAPDPDGDGWLQGPLTCEECNLWLAELLIRRLGRDVPLGNVGSHSLKATLLSWSAKFGLKGGDRRVLGYHAKSKDASVRDYARDSFAAPSVS